MLIEILKFIIYSGLIVIISKYILVKTLRNLAESLNLKPRTVGNIAGYATSIPELLTISISSINGLIDTSIYNILSSNIINFIQYWFATIKNKNFKLLKNKAIITDIVLVIITILIPVVLLILNLEINIIIVPIFIALFILFILINNKSHKKYLLKEDEQINKEVEKEIKTEETQKSKNKLSIIKYIIYLIIAGILLFFVGNQLGDVLENLCNRFNIPQSIIGILLGFITSIPELITFFESQKHHAKEDNKMLGVVESTNNLLTSNILNLFFIQSVGILITILLI